MQDRTLARFEAKIDKTGDCWIWTGGRFAKGYGQFNMGGRSRIASRVSYELFVGSIPGGLWVLHSCDNPPCVNPAHLFLGTPLDNSRDAQAKGRLVGNVKLKGEAMDNAGLADADALALRANRRAGMRNRDLAAKYGVTEQNAWQVCFARPWMDAIDGGVPRRRYRPRRVAA
jgi:hypothetical protein